MKKISVIILLFVVSLFIYSCTKDEGTSVAPPRDYSEQYLVDIALIEEFMQTHSVTVDANFTPTFTRITTSTPGTKISDRTDILNYKMVENTDDDGETFQYKVYYLIFREGTGNKPSRVDSVYTSYEGNRIFTDKEEVNPPTNPVTYTNFSNINQFEFIQQPVWFTLDNVIQGWSEIFQEFGTGTFTDNGIDPVSFQDYGAGVMFIPSGLAYYNGPQPGASYANLIFSFKLFALRYKDHDRDGILSKDEVNPSTTDSATGLSLSDYNRFYKYDSDGDEIANMFDIDDDGDGYQTKGEIRYSVISGTPPNEITTYFYHPFADIPTCGTGGNGKKKHLDPFCH